MKIDATIPAVDLVNVPTRQFREEQAQQRELIQAAKAVNESDLLGDDRELTFALDRDSRKTVIRIVSRETNEVIQQIPAEDVLHLARMLRDQIARTGYESLQD